MLLGGARPLPRSTQERAKARRTGQVAAQDDRREQDADGVAELGEHAVVDRRADEDVLLAGVAVQQNLEEGQERVEERAALAAGELLERHGRVGRQRQRAAGAAQAGDRRPGPVRREVQRRGRPLEHAPPVRELPAQNVLAQPRACPLRDVAELQCRLGERRRLPGGVRVVEHAQLAKEDDLRPLVEDDVVDEDVEDVVVVGEPQEPGAEKARATEVDRAPRLLVDHPLGRGLGIALVGEVDPLERERLAVGDHLHGVAVLERKARAERFVPAHELRERAPREPRPRAGREASRATRSCARGSPGRAGRRTRTAPARTSRPGLGRRTSARAAARRDARRPSLPANRRRWRSRHGTCSSHAITGRGPGRTSAPHGRRSAPA